MALLGAGLTPAEVDEVVLAGGSTPVPLVRRRLLEGGAEETFTTSVGGQTVATGRLYGAEMTRVIAGGRPEGGIQCS